MGELGRRVQRVGRHDDRPAAPDGLVGDDELGTVRHEDRDPVTGDDAESLQARRCGIDDGVQFGVGDGPVEEHERRPLPVASRRSAEQVVQRHGFPGHIDGDVLVVELVPRSVLHASRG